MNQFGFINLPKKLLLFYIGYDNKSDVQPVPILCDNLAALSVAAHPRQTPMSKHIQLKHFRIHDYQIANQIKPLWIPSEINASDIFTKILQPHIYTRLRMLLSMNFAATANTRIITERTQLPEYSDTSLLIYEELEDRGY